VEWGWIDRRPAEIKRYKEIQGRIVYLTVEEMALLIEAAKGDRHAQIHPFIMIGLETSMRTMEILSIRREHVSPERRVIFVPKAKGGMREQPITEGLATFLSSQLAAMDPDDQWLFPSPGAKSGHTVNMRDPYRRVVEAIGLNPDVIVRHTMRHTAITHLVQAGIDLPTVKRISGHKTLAMVERYAHQSGSHIQEAMDKFQNRVHPPSD
jgi:integrase